MIQRNDKLSRGLRGDKDVPVVDENDVNDKTTNNDDSAKNDSGNASSTPKDKLDSKANSDEPLKALDLQVIEWNQKLVSENNNLHQVRTGSYINYVKPFEGGRRESVLVLR